MILTREITVFIVICVTYLHEYGCEFDSAFQPNSVHVDSGLFTTESHVAYNNLTLPGYALDPDTPIILWWTGRLFNPDRPVKVTCPTTTCYIVNDRQYVRDPRTRILLFYGSDFEPGDLPLPRLNKHEWALLHEESPMNNYIFSHGAMIKLFNHTSTFRFESDFPLTSQFLYSSEYLTERKPVSLEIKNALRASGLAPVLYVQSHCDVASDRDRYVTELMKYINVDSIGKCVNNRDIPNDLNDPVHSMESKEFLDLISKYKFHISFENALCKDYMTEKLYRTFHVGSVPIYRGSENVHDWIPNNGSIIMTNNFTSVKDLADFTKMLDRDDNLYEEYLLYKTEGISNNVLVEHLRSRTWGALNKGHFIEQFECHLCQKIRERLKAEKAHETDPQFALVPPRSADSSHMGCPQPYNP